MRIERIDTLPPATKEREGLVWYVRGDTGNASDAFICLKMDDDTYEWRAWSASDDTILTGHIANTNNPHNVTKAQVGLANADNTSDVNKPVSTSQQMALDLKLATVDAPELIRDTVGTALVAGSNTTITVNDPGDTITIASSGATIAPSVFMYPHWTIPTTTDQTALPSGSSGFIYIGKAQSSPTSIPVYYNVTTAAVTVTWAEIAIFTGNVPATRGNASLTLRGSVTQSVAVTSTGNKIATVSVSGISSGDDVWIAYGSSASTPFQLRAAQPHELQTPSFQSAVVRPSLAASPQATTIVAANVPAAWMIARI